MESRLIIETEVANEPAAQRAYRALERMIVTLDLSPGGTTTEGALIERLALGRTPVREAIQRLAWDGLIEIRPRAGLAVAPLLAPDWPLVVDARAGVEIVLARSAARHASSLDRQRLREAADAMNAAVSAADTLAFLEADKQLDEVIAAASDNSFAVRVAAPLQTHSRRFWFRYQSDTGLAQSAEHHVRLIRAVLDGDEWQAGREAERLMGMLRQLAEHAARR
ncbi:GntR family transcriptional regulator [Neoaquamicrobium sediminum]|uniref:GntR family transcriptional regulator n=1 Tax=Neoaquamicrobium sediminum TaxID=1849104 RepID=UPI003BAC4482